MNEYWRSIANKIGSTISEKYIQEVHYYVGNHPCLLNLLNGAYWAEHESSNYISDNSDENNLSLSKKIVIILIIRNEVWRPFKNCQKFVKTFATIFRMGIMKNN